jgi:hypothetical protein
MNLTDLRIELETGPLSEAIAPLIESGNDGAIADLLNAPYATTPGAISRSLFAIWVAETGMRAVIRDHALNVNSPLRSIALSIEDFLQGAAETLDFAKPQNQAMLSAWVAANGCTQEQADDLLTRAGQSISRSQQVFGVRVSDLDIRRAIWNDNGTRAI